MANEIVRISSRKISARVRDQQERRDRREVRRRGRHDRARDLGRADVRRLLGVEIIDRRAAEDVLEHHDRVVEQQAGAQREAAERHDVQRQVADAHHDERREDRQRDRHADDEGLAERPQEHEHHEHGEHGADQRRVAHRVQRVADEAAWFWMLYCTSFGMKLLCCQR
jgi:hypothetical protein